MPKPLNELTIKELGKLFPVRLSDPDPNWKAMFAVESARIIQVLVMDEAKIHHMGSTAVPQLCAKPTIDMLLEVPETVDIAQVTNRLGQLGYDAVPRPNKPPPHLMFARGYTPTGYRGQAYHVHLRYFGDWDELYFRDYLIHMAVNNNSGPGLGSGK